MCGIVGILGQVPVAPLLVDALKRLEYRGYDSAGIATLEDGHLARRRAEGKLKNLEERLAKQPLAGKSGIGHTRWATHGAATEANAHPHATKRLALVHNGIIENFRELKAELAGEWFESATDTEVIAHLIDHNLEVGMEPEKAVEFALKKLKGAFAIVVLFEGYPDLMIGARRGSPLAIGHGENEMFFGSDAIALAPFTNRVTYLEDGDWAVLTRNGEEIFTEAGEKVERPIITSLASSLLVDRGNHRHYMAKEIKEQPEVVGHTLGRYINFDEGQVRLPQELIAHFGHLDRLALIACGTSRYACEVAKYWFERFARLPVHVETASEFRYSEQPLTKGGMSIVVSQSGETADTLASLRLAKQEGQTVVAIVNVPTSTIARESDLFLQTMAGPEIGVASTKAFTCQLAVFAAMAIAAGKARGHILAEEEKQLVQILSEVPRLMSETFRLEPQIEALAKTIATASDVLYLGRGTSYPIALEGALKLKEITYIHAEGYAAGELKHGPIALVDKTVPVVVVAPHDSLFEKTASNMQEVAARGGKIVLITDRKGKEAAALDMMATLVLPETNRFVAPIVYAIPVQLLAYHTAVALGTDIDQPRNLAKSVTVE